MDNEPCDRENFADLMQQVRAGSERAAWDLVEKYGPYIDRAIRKNLNQELRSKFDSQDFAQIVWASFFASIDRFADISDSRQLIGLLATMAHHKIVDENRRRFETQKYAIHREQPLATSGDEAEPFSTTSHRPSQIAVARELWNQMLAGQPSHYREVARRCLMGHTQRAIAADLGISERTVRRIIDRLENLC